MALGPYASFIIGSYLAAALVVGGLIAWVLLDYRAQSRKLATLDDPRRRSPAPSGRSPASASEQAVA